MSSTEFDPHNPTGDHPRVKLGALPSPHDPRTLNLSTYLTPDLPQPPPAVDWSTKASGWRLLGNDVIGDCEVVTCANLVQTWTSANTDGGEVRLTKPSVVRAYSAITGYDPRTGANDTGIATLNMLNYWRQRGVGGRKIEAFVRLDHRNPYQVRTACNLFGGVFTAFALPRSAGAQFDRHEPWDVAAMAAGGARGSWGGHAVASVAYDADGTDVITWGRKQRVTWAFWAHYASEAWSVLSSDWTGPDGSSPVGFDLDHLRADVAQIAKVRSA